MKDIFQYHYLPFTAMLLKDLPADYYALSELTLGVLLIYVKVQII